MMWSLGAADLDDSPCTVQTNPEFVFSESKVRATIKGNFVRLMKNIKQLFVCEAKTNVTFYYSTAWAAGLTEGLHPITSPISYSYDDSSSFPFSATFNADPKEFGNFVLIHCIDSQMAENLRQVDLHEAVLHTWEYSSRGIEETSIQNL